MDGLDLVLVDNYDMRFLQDLDDDVILLEWDIAVAQHDLVNFIAHARMAPHLIHVAPYVLYPESLDEIVAPVWAHRHMLNEMPLQMKWIDYGDSCCDIFSTGMIYLPGNIIQDLSKSDNLITWHNNITDSKLAFWYHHTYKQKVPVHWDCRPIHLHYDQERFYAERDIRRIDTRRPSFGNRQPVETSTGNP